MLPQPSLLPDLAANKLQRAQVKAKCLLDEEYRQKVYLLCSRNFKFWAEHFCYAYDEHKKAIEKTIPLVLWDFQEEMINEIIENCWRAQNDENYFWNAGADKARKMTATFSALLVSQWFAQFHGVTTVITSKTEGEVDIQGDMDSPFERLRWQIEQQYNDFPWLFPPEFVPKKGASWYKTALINFKNGGQITGKAPTGTAMRQGRALIWIGDEFAFVKDGEDYKAWEGAAGKCKVRLVFSTPNGPFCKFYQLISGAQTGKGEQFHLFELDWWLHPIHAQGLYKRSDGSFSSPYMDAKIAGNTKQVIAREYLRDHGQSVGGRVFHMFNRSRSAVDGLKPDFRQKTIYRSWDTGGTTAVVFGQKDRYGRLLILREVVLDRDTMEKNDLVGETLLKAVARKAIQIAEEEFAHFEIVDIGDPYGSRLQLAMQDKTEYDLLREWFDIRVISAFMYDIKSHERVSRRIEILSDLMTTDTKLDDDTTSLKLLIDPKKCPTTIEAFTQGYRRRVSDSGEVTDEIMKQHPFIDVVDAAGMIGVKLFDDSKKESNGDRRPPKPKKQKWRPTERRRNYG